MKAFLLLPLFTFAGVAFASHNMSCDVATKVTDVKSLMRLDGAVTYSNQQTLVPSDYEQLVWLEITAVSNQGGRPDCGHKVGDIVSLLADKSKVNQIAKDQVLNLHFQNFGDRAASRVTWTIIP